jgi:hypothetical protein
MKKIFAIAALAALTLTACNTIVDIDTKDDQKSISFEAFSHKSTKAGVITKDNLVEFNVEAYYNTATPAVHYFSTTAKENQNTTAATYWGTPTIYYWPTDVKDVKTGSTSTKTMSFFAYKNLSSFNGNSYPTAKPSLTKTVADAITAQDDALVASNENTGYVVAVPITFGHVLSRIDVVAKAKVYNGLKMRYTIESITIGAGNKVKNSGKYTFGTGWSDLAGSKTYTLPVDTLWTATSPYVVDATGTTTPTTNYDALTTTGNGSFMLMPQSLTDIVLTVKYKAECAAADEDVWVPLFDDTKTANLQTTAVAAWEAGKWYKYQISIDAESSDLKQIQFEVSVTDWAAATSQAVTLQ